MQGIDTRCIAGWNTLLHSLYFFRQIRTSIYPCPYVYEYLHIGTNWLCCIQSFVGKRLRPWILTNRRGENNSWKKHTKARSGTYKSSSNHPSKRHNAQHLSFQFISERLSSLSSAYLNSSRGLHSRRHRRHLRLKIPVKEVSLSLLLLV